MAIEATLPESKTAETQWVDESAGDDNFGDVPVQTQTMAEKIPAADSAPAATGGEVPGSVPAKTDPVPVESEFPAELLSRAGLTAEQAAAEYGTPEALDKAVLYFDRQMLKAGQQQAPQTPAAVPQQQSPPAAQAPAAGQLPTQQAPVVQPVRQDHPFTPDERFKFKLDLDPETWDPDTVKLLTGLNEHTAKQFTELSAKIAEVEQLKEAMSLLIGDRVEQQKQQYVREFDSQLESLGETYVDVFGKGSGTKLEKSSEEFKNRVKLDSAMRQLQDGRRSHGLEPLPASELMQRALRLEFPEKQSAIVQDKVSSKLGQRQRQFVARPTARASSKSPDDSAVSAVEAILRKRGVSIAAGVDDDEDGSF